MKLTDLNPKFRGGFGEVTDDFALAIGIHFDCPGCAGTRYSHPIWAPFQGRYTGPGPKWAAGGTGYQDLTFSDSAQGSRSIRVLGGCCSHFNVTGGEIDFYADSGHNNPRERPMTDETQATEPETQAEVTTAPAPPAAPPPTVDSAPMGFVRTAFLSFVNGVLHQEWHNPFVGGDHPPKVLVPVPGTAPAPEGTNSVPAAEALLSKIETMLKEHAESLEARIVQLEQRLAEKAAQTPPPSA